MKFISYFTLSFITTAVVFYAQVFLLFPVPVAADYWVREMLVIKRDLSKSLGDRRKIVVAAGSNVLFNIDTNQLTEALGLPAINFGLMAGLPLDTILRETDAIVRSGDVLVLALEQDYYCREKNPGFNEWQIRNAIAWDHNYWRNMGFLQQLRALTDLNPLFPIELIQAKIGLLRNDPILTPRLLALDDGEVLNKYYHPSGPPDNLYSIYNIDHHGNIKNSNETSFTGTASFRADLPIPICPQAIASLGSFIARLKSKNVLVFFINGPFMDLPDLDKQKLAQADEDFIRQIAPLAPILDNRQEILVPRDSFLNSEMHLNIKGRDHRTQILILRLRDQLKLY